MTVALDCWAIPGGQEILPADAPREEWLTTRRQGIGGSDIPNLMGVLDYVSSYKMWRDKTGRDEHEPQTEPMRRGNWLEAPILEHFTERTGLEIRRRGLIRSNADPRILTTLDGLVIDGGIIEAKSIGQRSKVAEEWRDGGVARHAWCQLQWQLLVTGRSHGWLAAYIIDEEPMVRGPFERDERLMARMRDRALTWWDTYVATDIAPPVDLVTVTDEEIKLRWPTAAPGSVRQAEWPAHLRTLLQERAEVKAAIKPHVDRAKEIDKALAVMVGEDETLAIGDIPVLTRKTRQNSTPAIDHALETDHPDIWAQYINYGTHREINVCKGWELT